jgi:uncharacterized phage protein gp47/JayE
MPVYLKKTKSEILAEALEKIQRDTPITSVGPGSIARSLIEAITTELGDIYDILDFNVTQSYLSTATGAALNSLGALYGVERKTVSNLAAIDKSLGSFYFYIASSIGSDIVIPSGTKVYTSATSYVGRQHSFSTVGDTTIPAGRTKAYASLQPDFTEAVFTAGSNTLTFNSANVIGGTTVFCTNPRSISPLPSFETDEDYRIRVMKQIRVNAAGTLESVRYAGLAVPNVRDVKIRSAPYGMGSFEAVIVPESTANVEQTMEAARQAIEAVKPLGVRMFTKSPIRLPVDIVIDVFVPGGNSATITNAVTSRIEVGIRRYLQSFLPGNQLTYNRLIQIALDANEYVKDVSIASMNINGIPQLKKNYQPKDDEQITSGNIVVNIASS